MTDHARQWIDVRVRAECDAGDLLAGLQDPNVMGAWEEDGIIHLYWPRDAWSADVLHAVKQAVRRFGADESAVIVETLLGLDWNALWVAPIKPLRIGRRIVIRPSWESIDLRPDEIEVVLDPKQAFGTGHHATTRMLIEWLEEAVHGGERVLDVGTGSGILVMVALRLGAVSALGIDHDPVAIDCARGYAAENGFGSELDLRACLLEQIGPVPFDLILANLDRRTLVNLCVLFPPLLAVGGSLLLSGLVADDRSEIGAALSDAGGAIRREREQDGWLAFETSFED